MASRLKLGEKIIFGIGILFLIAAILGYIGLEVHRANLNRPMYVNTTSFDFTAEGLRGSQLFRSDNCSDCHRAVRNGTNHGVSLDGVGSIRSEEYLYAFLKNPEATYGTKTEDHGPNKSAAYVSKLPPADLHAMAVFLSELKATQGSPDARLPMAERNGFVDEMVKLWAPDSWKTGHKDLRDEAAGK
ncbi:c-type cytochrome [Polynucleobacter sphagniphilus]|jgi:cytochrome c553|uniref:c-type cytochrome n=1 Tax=Polynucleobacter sphagniphilus TaxID=1743169 RepID=UPI0024745BCB|nr:c-type cytochrome [Polynucleobacter sphagniphilus]MDH6524591.1 cytochrome c553 [Polynucleobacter sphagniphilus]